MTFIGDDHVEGVDGDGDLIGIVVDVVVPDDFGTFEADPYLLQCAALPLRRDITEPQISAALVELEQARLVDLYVVRGERYGRILGFEAMQPANKNGRRILRYPPPGESGGILGNPGESGCAQEIQASETKTKTTTTTNTENKKENTAPSPAAKAHIKTVSDVEIPQSLQTDPFRKSWESWQQHRRELKKKITPLAAQRQLEDLEAMGEARAVVAIERSIKNGWTGIFEEKTNGNPKQQHAGAPGRQFDERIELR